MEVNSADPHTPFIKNQGYDRSSLTVPPHLVDTRETREALADYYRWPGGIKPGTTTDAMISQADIIGAILI